MKHSFTQGCSCSKSTTKLTILTSMMLTIFFSCNGSPLVSLSKNSNDNIDDSEQEQEIPQKHLIIGKSEDAFERANGCALTPDGKSFIFQTWRSREMFRIAVDDYLIERRKDLSDYISHSSTIDRLGDDYYMTNVNDQSIVIFDQNFHIKKLIHLPEPFYTWGGGNVKVGPGNRIWYTANTGEDVIAVDADGNEVIRYLHDFQVRSLAFDHGGRLLIADTQNRVKAYNIDYDLQVFTQELNISGFNSPRAINVLSDNTIVVSDYSNRRVKRYSDQGVIIDNISLRAAPTCMATFHNKIVYHTHYKGIHFIDFDEATPEQETIYTNYSNGTDGFSSLEDLRMDENGDLIIADYSNQRVVITDKWGDYKSEFHVACQITGSAGNTVYQSSPKDGEIFVTMAGCRQIQVYDYSGNLLRAIGTGINGDADGDIKVPDGLTFYENEIFVVDPSNKRVSVFDKDTGVFIRTISGPGALDGEFSGPRRAEVDTENKLLYVSDRGKGKIFVYDLDNSDHYLMSIAAGTGDNQDQLPAVWSIAIKNNLIFAIDSTHNQVKVFNRFNGQWQFNFLESGGRSGQAANPFGLMISHEDDWIYVADSGNKRIQVFHLNGEFVMIPK